MQTFIGQMALGRLAGCSPRTLAKKIELGLVAPDALLNVVTKDEPLLLFDVRRIEEIKNQLKTRTDTIV